MQCGQLRSMNNSHVQWLAFFLCFLLLHGSAFAGAVHGDWVGASMGQIPNGALRSGNEPDGSAQYVCRGRYALGLHVGKIVAGYGGCVITYSGKAHMLPNYEVLATPPLASALKDELIPPEVVPERKPPATPVTPDSTTTVAVSRGFDDAGKPYFEERMADGTVVYRTRSFITTTKPDGSKITIPIPKPTIETQGPTPPELPTDPDYGRRWLEVHNAQLLRLISQLVNDSASEMEKFSEAEKTNAGDNLFAQIIYRTDIANFLAAAR